MYLGIQPDYAMKIGGWSDYHTMKKIYTHVSNRDLEKASQPLIDFFVKISMKNKIKMAMKMAMKNKK